MFNSAAVCGATQCCSSALLRCQHMLKHTKNLPHVNEVNVCPGWVNKEQKASRMETDNCVPRFYFLCFCFALLFSLLTYTVVHSFPRGHVQLCSLENWEWSSYLSVYHDSNFISPLHVDSGSLQIISLPPNHSHSAVSTLQTSYSDSSNITIHQLLIIMRWLSCSTRNTA